MGPASSCPWQEPCHAAPARHRWCSITPSVMHWAVFAERFGPDRQKLPGASSSKGRQAWNGGVARLLRWPCRCRMYPPCPSFLPCLRRVPPGLRLNPPFRSNRPLPTCLVGASAPRMRKVAWVLQSLGTQHRSQHLCRRCPLARSDNCSLCLCWTVKACQRQNQERTGLRRNQAYQRIWCRLSRTNQRRLHPCFYQYKLLQQQPSPALPLACRMNPVPWIRPRRAGSCHPAAPASPRCLSQGWNRQPKRQNRHNPPEPPTILLAGRLHRRLLRISSRA